MRRRKALHQEIEMQVPLTEKMICRYLKEAGYVTAAMKWRGRATSDRQHGFDVYHPGRANTELQRPGGKANMISRRRPKFIEELGPPLLRVPVPLPHIPYDAQQHIQNSAQAFEPVYAVDRSAGRRWAGLVILDALKLADKTLVVFLGQRRIARARGPSK